MQAASWLVGQYCPLSLIYNRTDPHLPFHTDEAKNGFSQTLLRDRMGISGFSPVCITDSIIINSLSFCLSGKFKKQHTFPAPPSVLAYFLPVSTSNFE